jgi:hypothetical protein
VRVAAGGDRLVLGRHQLRHRLRTGPDAGGRAGGRAARLSHLEVAGHGAVLPERHPRRHLRTFLVDLRRIGQRLAGLLPLASVGAPGGTVVVLGMAAYFSRVVQAPITAAVTVLEMTSNHALAVPLMATSPVAFVASRLVCRRPFYSSMARCFLKH